MSMLHVHVIGCGHATTLPLHHLAGSSRIRTLTIESRSAERVSAVVDDLQQTFPDRHRDISAETLDSVEPDIILLAFGRTIRPGETREVLLAENAQLVLGRLEGRLRGDPFLIVVTNPVDTITETLRLKFGLQPGRLVGVGGDLDAARVQWALKRPEADVIALGEHSEQAAFLIDGKPLPELGSGGEAIRDLTRDSLRKQLLYLGAPAHCPGRAIIRLLDSLVEDTATRHLLSIFHQEWGTTLTWPVRVKGMQVVPENLTLPLETRSAVADIASKNQRMVRALLLSLGGPPSIRDAA